MFPLKHTLTFNFQLFFTQLRITQTSVSHPTIIDLTSDNISEQNTNALLLYLSKKILLLTLIYSGILKTKSEYIFLKMEGAELKSKCFLMLRYFSWLYIDVILHAT